MIRFIALLALLLPASRISAPSGEIPSNGQIPRFLMVAVDLYRGGQPTEKGFELLKQLGIKTVINLRLENDESEIVQKFGMNYVYIPVEDIRPWTQIPEAALGKYFELVNNPQNYPIFFHCHRGADRTGALAALYRIAVQGWHAQEAYAEARSIGMRSWYAGLKTQLYKFHPTERAKLQPAIESSPQ